MTYWKKTIDPDWRWPHVSSLDIGRVPVALIYPPMPFLADPHAQPPLGLMSVAAALKLEEFPVKLYDWSMEINWMKRLDDIEEDVVGCYVTYPHFNFTASLHRELKRMGKKLIVGGPDPSGHAGDYFDRADVVVMGEGELGIFDAVRYIQNGVKGLVHREPIPNLNCVPWPCRSFPGFDINRFKQDFHGGRLTTFMFSRGCFHKCSFCDSKSVWGRRVRWRTPNDCAAEVDWVRTVYGFDRFFPEDDTFNTDNEWVMEFCRLIRTYGMLWRCLTRASRLNSDVAMAMSDAGCRRVSIGVESGSDEILKNISKGESADGQLRGIRVAQKAGIEVQAFFIIGLPGETKQTLEETKRFIEEARPELFDMTLLRVLPGSDIYNDAKAGKIDLQTLPFEPEQSWFKGGIPKANARTKALSAEDLERAYAEMYDLIKSQGAKHSVGHYIKPTEYKDIKEVLDGKKDIGQGAM